MACGCGCSRRSGTSTSTPSATRRCRSSTASCAASTSCSSATTRTRRSRSCRDSAGEGGAQRRWPGVGARKWNRLGRWYYQACAWLAPKLPIVLVSDARVIAAGTRAVRQADRVHPVRQRRPPAAARRDARAARPDAGRYLLYVSRLEPENHADTVLDGYRAAGGLAALGVPLVIVGDAPYATDYKAASRPRAAETPGVMLTGYVFGDGYAELQSNALLYVQATEVGGTHPALVEAMGRGACDRRQRRSGASRGPRGRGRATTAATMPPISAASSASSWRRAGRAALGAAAADGRERVLVGPRHGRLHGPLRAHGGAARLTGPSTTTCGRGGARERGVMCDSAK